MPTNKKKMGSYMLNYSSVSTIGANPLVLTNCGYLYTISRWKVGTKANPARARARWVWKKKFYIFFSSDRYYSTSNSDLQSSDLPLPVLTINNLNDKDSIKSYRILLKNKGGIYSFINTVNGNQYIGSAKDFYLRLNEHRFAGK
uniref:hypothetical protein n=1 Tax=Dematophora necatrix TaxID=2751867 RepID=UPI0030FE5249